MKKSLFLLVFGLLLLAPPAQAVAPCSSGFCNGGGNGAQCTLGGATHTCGVCMGNTSVLYVGDLSPAQAEERCRCQHDPAYSCSIRPGTIRTATMVKEKAAPETTPTTR